MNTTSLTTSIITPVIKHTIHGSLVLWEDTSRVSSKTSLYKPFLAHGDDYCLYTPVRFEKL